MSINKIVQPIVDSGTRLVSKAAQSTGSSAIKTIAGGKEKLTGALDGLASSAKAGVVQLKKQPSELPEFLYHMTSLENYKKMLESGKINFSDFEAGANGCHGIYLVDRKNFLTKWMGAKNQELFGDFDVGQMLLMMVNKDGKDMVAIKIPTSSLDTSKLKFRPYFEACRQAISSFDDTTNLVGSELVKSGWDISELGKYIDTEPVEYIYQKEIPSSLLGSITQTDAALDPSEIVKNLFH